MCGGAAAEAPHNGVIGEHCTRFWRRRDYPQGQGTRPKRERRHKGAQYRPKKDIRASPGVLRSGVLLLATVAPAAGATRERAAGSIPRRLRARKRRASGACAHGGWCSTVQIREVLAARARAWPPMRRSGPTTAEVTSPRPRPSVTDSSHTGRPRRAQSRRSDPTRPAGAPRPHDRPPAGPRRGWDARASAGPSPP
jgi:hypothetical protein